MQRPRHPTAVAERPGLAYTPGTPGFYDRGDPTVPRLATVVTPDDQNDRTEVLAHPIEKSGQTLEAGAGGDDQLTIAIQTISNINLRTIAATANVTLVAEPDTRGCVLDCNATAANITVTLPAAATAGDGFTVAIRKTDATSHAVSVPALGNLTLALKDGGVIANSDGAAWRIIASHNLATPTPDVVDLWATFNAMRAAAKAQAGLGAARIHLYDGFVDTFTTAAGVDAARTVWSFAGGKYRNRVGGSVPDDAGTILDASYYEGEAALSNQGQLFTGANAKQAVNCATGSESTGWCYVGKQWDAPKKITAFELFPSSDLGWASAGFGPGFPSIWLQGSDDGETWVNLGTTNVTSNAQPSAGIASGLPDVAYLYHRIRTDLVSFGTICLAKLNFTESLGSITNGNLTTTPVAAEASPTRMHAYAVIEDITGSITLGDDVKMLVSRNNGTSFAELTLERHGLTEDGHLIVAGDITLAADVNTSILAQLRAANLHDMQVHELGVGWRA